ncbi:MAG TPA: carboxypeptidase regulatory-like domain-containing protein, partial [Chitinophagaceae bacterium]|nr:carboxypeptidase regulatory-like domain-containing protein [Chitinophagaceae bacterium]
MKVKIAYVLKYLRGTAILVLLLTAYQANAQVTVTGTVKNEEGTPLQNVSVQVKGFPAATRTDKSGQYKLEIKPQYKIL